MSAVSTQTCSKEEKVMNKQLNNSCPGSVASVAPHQAPEPDIKTGNA